MKNILLAVVALLIIGAGVYFFMSNDSEMNPSYEKPTPMDDSNLANENLPNENENNPAEDEEVVELERGAESIVGTSEDGKNILAYHFGEGEKEVLLIGNIHGGYSWNTALLGYEIVDWFKATPSLVPEGLMVTVIPTLNPDGLAKVTGKTGSFVASDVKASEAEKIEARFNSNMVDLNRNFDCQWSEAATWQNKDVSGGSAPFSEAETKSLQTYVSKFKPSAVIAWYSSAGGVYASQCGESTLPGTLAMTKEFAEASGYTPHEVFDYYDITGDMVNWFAKQNIPAISVLLSNHTNTELTKNKAGIQAVLSSLAN